MRRALICVLFFVVAAGVRYVVRAQTTLNPDISIIPRFRVDTDDGAKLSEGERVWRQPDLQFEELEVVAGAYLNPYARADIVFTLSGPDVENARLGLEEAYLTVLKGLPLGLNIRLGKYRAEFGKLNMIHPHAWPFVTQPLVAGRFLGEEGLNDLGVSVSTLLPTGDVYTRLTVDLLRGAAIGETTGIPDTSGSAPAYALSGRLMTFFPWGDDSDLEVGLSGYTGLHDPYYRDRFWYGNLDAKFKYRPSSYTSVTLQGELLWNWRTAHQDAGLLPFLNAQGQIESRSISSGGAYLYADVQFMKIYSIGARLDWSESPYGADDLARAFAVFAGFYPVEESLGVRLQYQHTRTENSEGGSGVNAVVLQVMFSLGPHKAHPF